MYKDANLSKVSKSKSQTTKACRKKEKVIIDVVILNSWMERLTRRYLESSYKCCLGRSTVLSRVIISLYSEWKLDDAMKIVITFEMIDKKKSIHA